MKRPHRRAHLLLWLVLAPIAALGVVYGLQTAPAEPVSDLPDVIAAEGSR